LNRLIYYPTGSYGTFVQWLCNTVNISGAQDLPFHTDGNSHQYVLTDQYRLLISEQDEQDVRTKRALRADDGFYSTFVLRKLSRKVSMFAVKRGWTPNQITLASLILALIVSGFFATGWWPLMIVGAIGVQVSIIIDCADGEVEEATRLIIPKVPP
jgi:hypothetical protein